MSEETKIDSNEQSLIEMAEAIAANSELGTKENDGKEIETKPVEVEPLKETKETKETKGDVKVDENGKKEEDSDSKKLNVKVPVSQIQKQRKLKQEALKKSDEWEERALKAEEKNQNIKDNARLNGEEVDDKPLEITEEDIQDAIDEGDVAKAKRLILDQKEQNLKKSELEAKKSSEEDTTSKAQDEAQDEAFNDSGLAEYYAKKDEKGNPVVVNGVTEKSSVFIAVEKLDSKEPLKDGESLTNRWNRMLNNVLSDIKEPQGDLNVGVKTASSHLDVWQKAEAGIDLSPKEEQEFNSALYQPI